MKNLIITLGVLVAFLIVSDVSAQSIANVPNKTDVRQKTQQVRIAQGVKSGELNRAETHRLRQEQRTIRRNERRIEADGVVTRREQKRLDVMQNKASRDIRRQKHDPHSRVN